MTEPVVSIYPVNQRLCITWGKHKTAICSEIIWALDGEQYEYSRGKTFQTSGEEYKVSEFTSLMQKLTQTRTLKYSYMIHPLSAFGILYANKYRST
jgi:hypothetical protein